MLRITITVTIIILVSWLFLTLWAERPGPKRSFQSGPAISSNRMLIVYDPDPFYNLDEKICESVGKMFADKNWNVKTATVLGADAEDTSYDLYVFCANTYNWSPDWEVTRLIERMQLDNKNVIAITVGGGSTQRSKREFERIIEKKKAILIASKTFWLWRPNDKSRMKEPNVRVAIDMAGAWAKHIADSINFIVIRN